MTTRARPTRGPLKRRPAKRQTAKRPAKRPPTIRGCHPSNPTTGAPLGAAQIRIRMYRVGFGDCFLVSVPVAPGDDSATTHAHLLIDCGVHARGDIGTITDVVDDIAHETGGKLAVVIATHAHQDHISGFDRCASQFARMTVGQVWLPWTWDPENPQAVKLAQSQASLTAHLAAHFAALGPVGGASGGAAGGVGGASDAARAAIENLTGNAHALALLKGGLGGGKVRYVKAGDQLAVAESGVPGLAVQFLGPPESEEFLAQMDPPAGQRYLALGRAGGPPTWINGIVPFGAWWRADPRAPEVARLRLTARDESQIAGQAASLGALAFALDQARNNESVVALLAVRDRYLLFPGDAQYGNWHWWLEHEHPEVILPELCFFKVAHHGSVNATPKAALEHMSEGKFAAMVSTQSVPWSSIPRVPLMVRLEERTQGRLVRSDWIPVPKAPTPARGVPPEPPARLPAGFARGPLWFDYVIDT